MQSQNSITDFKSPIDKFPNAISTKSNIKITFEDQDLERSFYFDYFSKRIAFATSEGRIKIFSILTKDQNVFEKTLDTEFSAHQGTIKSISWQNPKYGVLLATCGIDNKIILWKEEGNIWKQEIQLKKTHNSPLIVKWVDDINCLGIAYQNGCFQLFDGDSYEILLEQQLYESQLFCFDIQQIEEKLILVSCGSDKTNIQFNIFVLQKQDSYFTNRLSLQIQGDYQFKKIVIAPYIIDNELKIGFHFNSQIGIFTYDIQNLDFIQRDFQILEVQECFDFQWSPLGNEILVYGANKIRLFQQNIRNKFQAI